MKKILIVSLTTFLAFAWVFASSGTTGIKKPIKETTPVVQTPTKNDIKWLIILNDFYALDEDFVYSVNAAHTNWVKVANADRVTFKVLGGQFAGDVDQIFQMGKKLNGVDIETFKVIQGQYGYAQDKNHVFGPNGLIVDADPATFTMVTKNYTTDAGHVFFDGKIVAEANSGSLEVIDKGLYAIDDKNVFYAGKLVEGANPDNIEVQGDRATTADGRVFVAGKLEEAGKGTNTVKENTGFLALYMKHFTGKNIPFWIVMGAAMMAFFSLLFVFFADRNDENAYFSTTIAKVFVALVSGVIVFWIASIFTSSHTSAAIGLIVVFIVFIGLWSAMGWIKSFLITLLTLIAFVFIYSFAVIIARAFFGDIAHVLSYLDRPEIRLMGIMKVVGIILGTWLIMTQLGSSLFRSFGQALVATIIALGLLYFLIWIGTLGTLASVIVFTVIYAVILWIMRFRMVSNLFAETVRIIRIALIIAVVVGVLIWIIL